MASTSAANGMQMRDLGTTGIHVSLLGLGTVKLGRDEGVAYAQPFRLPSDAEAADLLAAARSAGVNLLDTAPAYGIAEERLGALLDGQRHEWCIATKVGEEFAHGKSRFDFSGRHTRYSVERSLRRLRTDYLDVVLVHSDGNDEHILEHTDCVATLRAMQQQGLIRAVGFSSKSVQGGLIASRRCDVVMVTLNIEQQTELPVIGACHALQRGVLIKKALRAGHLLPHVRSTPVGSTPSQENFRLLANTQGISSVVIGTTQAAHLQQCADALLASLDGTHGG